MRPPPPESIDAADALGLLIIGAVEHLISRDHCCFNCCMVCAGLAFYWTQASHIADLAVGQALDGQSADWFSDGAVNWPYLVLFWHTPADHVCPET